MTVKHRLMAGVAAASIAFAPPAHAVLGVGDVVFDPSAFAEMLNQSRAMAQELAMLRQQYAVLQQQYAAIAHLPDTVLQELGSMLNTPQYRSPLPDASGIVRDLMAGNGLSGMGALGQGYLDRNTLYAMPGADPMAGRTMAIGRSVAGVQGMLDGLYQSVASRITIMQALEGQLASAPDAKATADIQARIAAESTYLQAHQTQAGVLNTWQASQVRNDEAQYEQIRRCQIDAVLADMKAGRPSGTTGEDCGRQPAAPAMPEGSSPMVGITPSGAPVVAAMAGAGSGATAAGGSAALDRMLAQPWGAEAAQNAASLGVNPSALAGVGQIESGFRDVAARPGSTISGPFQMVDSTERNALRTATGTASLSTTPGGQSLAAAQELKTAAQALQRQGIANPVGTDVRALYQFGQAGGMNLARADGSVSMASVLPAYSPDVLRANGVQDMTVAQWRADVARKMGDSAYQPVLLTTQRT